MENLKNIKFAYFVSTVLFQLALVSSVQASSITSPLVSDSNTVGLWNFNLDPNDASNAVVDSGPNGINGTAYNAPLASSIPGLAGFGAARQFTTANGFVDFGVTKGSKLDLSGKTAAAIEAYIEPTAAMPGVSMIFDDGQIQLAVINNELAAFVAQSSGYKGVVASAPLTLNVPVRVGMSFADGVLGIFINEKNVGTVAISEPIAANPNANAHAFIGGNVLSQFFAGYIDDVRVSSSGRFDSVPPTITLATPAPGSLVTDAYPVFNFGLTDQGSGGIVSGIDPTSFQVYLNGVLESGLSVSVSGATGKLHDPLVFGQANEIKVIVSDLAGNTTTQSFFLNYSGNGGGTEYASDSHTLALWHMDEATPNYMPDSSPHAYHGYANGTVSVGQGVFGNGRVFRGTGSDFISIPLVAISNHKFTFETWMQPAYDHANGYSGTNHH